MKVRVLQGHSACYGGIWFNQGEVFECRESDKFESTMALYDEQGKYLGQRVVSQVETIQEAVAESPVIEQPKAKAPKQDKKEEG